MSTTVKIKGSLAVLLGAASFGILSTFVKKAYALEFTLGEVTGAQMLFGAAFLWIAHLLSGRSSTRPPRTKHRPWQILLCGITTGAVSILYYKSVELLPASIAIVLLMQYIWIGTLVEWIIFRSDPSKIQVIGSILVICGAILATGLVEKGLNGLSIIGVVYGLLAATAFSMFIILNGRIGKDYPVLQKSALMISGAGILVWIILTPTSLLSLEVFKKILPYGLILSLFGTVIPPTLFAYGMPKTGYSLGGILSSVELPVAVAMSYFILGEDVSFLQWSGVFFILAVVALINLYFKKHSQ